MRIKSWPIILILLFVVMIIVLFWLRVVPVPVSSTSDAAQVGQESIASRREDRPQVGPPEIYPRTDLNPGFANPDITQDNIAETICNKDWKTSAVRPPSNYTTKLKIAQIADYGFADTNTGDYEEDH